MEALRTVIGGLPRDLPATVFAVMHMSAGAPGVLPDLLSRAGPLPAKGATDGEVFRSGHVYVACPDHHLLIERGRMRVTRGPKENRSRPAVDVLFRSAATAYGPRVIGVVLTGALGDGASGLAAIHAHGGEAVVQEPSEALFPSMPMSALRAVPRATISTLARMPDLLAGLVGEPAASAHVRPRSPDGQVALTAGQPAGVDALGEPSPYGCPDCGGVLAEVKDDAVLRFRCRVGHAFGAESLVGAQDESIEGSLWAALRALEESASLKQRLAERLRAAKAVSAAARLDLGAREASQHAESLRRLLGSLDRQLVEE